MIDVNERRDDDDVNDGHEVVWMGVEERKMCEDLRVGCDEEKKATN